MARMDGIDKAQARVTRLFLATPETLQGFEGIQVFSLHDGVLSPAAYPNDDPIAYVYFEVRSFAAGSWWVATSTEAQTAWQGAVPVEAEGYITSAHLLRPVNQFWWIPGDEIDVAIGIETVFGTLRGNWPESPPPQAG